MKNHTHIFIINPVSGKGRGLKVGKNIEAACQKMGWEYEIQYTRHDLSAEEIAKTYKDGKDGKSCVLWAVGGDGTVHEVLNGVAGTDNYLSLIPLGSGNDFNRTIREVGAPADKIDIGKINGKYFLNSICFGLDGQVANNLDMMRKPWIPSSQKYTASIVYTFFTHREKMLHYALDGREWDLKSTMLTICNGRYYGGGYKVAPMAMLDDGEFELLYSDYIPRLLVIPQLLKLIRGVLYKSKKITAEKITKIRISAEEELACNVDGEVMRAKDFEIEIVPGAVKFYNNQKMVDMALTGVWEE